MFWSRILLFSMAGAGFAFGQSAAAGALEGSVRDPAGQRVAEARVVVVNAATGERREVGADTAGAFRFALLPAGKYVAEFAREGFRTARMEGLTVAASDVATSLRLTTQAKPNV